MKQKFKNILIFCGAFFIFAPLFVFSQESTFTLKEKQAIDLVSIIRKYPLTDTQRDFYDQSLYYSDSAFPVKTGAVMLVKQAILQSELDYWFVKMPVEFSKRFIKALYKLLPAVAFGDFSGVIDLIEKYTVEQANIYIDTWLKQNQVLIGSGIGKYAFNSFKNNPQVINIPYIIVYLPTGVDKAKIVVEFYSQKPIEPPESRGSAEGNMDWATKTSWPKDRWITSKYNKNDKIEPFIVRVKGQVVKDKYGNFSWDKNVVDIRYQPLIVEVEFGKPVPEIDQSDIILKDLQANQSQGFIKDKINEIKQKAQGVIDQIKQFLEIFNSPKPTAQISSFVGSEGDSPPLDVEPRAPQESLQEISEQSQEIANQAEQIIAQDTDTTYDDLLKIKTDLEQAIREKQEELNQLLASSSQDITTTSADSASSSQADSVRAVCNQATNQEPCFDKVIFNEIAWMGGVKSSSDEWIELKNISVRPVDLNGWQIFNKSQNLKIFFTTTTVVESGGFLLLERTNDDTVPKIKADYIYTGALANTDEMLYLVGPSCVLQDKIIAIPFWKEGDNTTKETMERNQFYGWQTSSVVGGTPKAKNSVGKSKSLGGSGASANSQFSIINFQNTTTTATTTSQATSTQQATTSQQATTTIEAPQILIVEIQITDGSSTHDFIKLFNQSTSSVADISDWQLKKRTSGITESSIKEFSDRQFLIQPQNYFLWMNSDYALTTTTKPDATTTQTIASNNSIALFNQDDEIVDQVAWGSSTNPFVEGIAFAENPSAGRNLVRKQVANQYQDTGDNSVDFELSATTTQPENLLPELSSALSGITNLMAVPSTVRGSVDLFWTCSTSATAYIIKKSEQEITTTTWDTAQTISQNITPKPAGEVEILSVDNLPSDRKTYFAIKYASVNSAQALSSISGSVSVRAWSGFQDNNDGTITDLRTNLFWQKDANSAINNFGITSTQNNAVAFLTTQNPWRLPNFKEMTSLIEYKPGISSIYGLFENAKLEKYWSISKRFVSGGGYAGPARYTGWYADLSNGQIDKDYYDNGQSRTYPFMAVLGQEIPEEINIDSFNFTNNNDGTIKDNRTGLLWLKAELAQIGDNAKNWKSAFNFATNAVLCNDGTLKGTAMAVGDCSANGGVKYDDFRLPNIQEITEMTKHGMALNSPPILIWQGGFASYWSSTMFDENNFWQAGNDYNIGVVIYRGKSILNNVQLVRDP